MKRLFLLAFLALTVGASAAEPLRIYIRSGVKTHGPNAHDHPHFLKTWTPLLTERGMKVEGAIGWPNAEQFARTDVIIVDADEAGDATAEQQQLVNEFTKRGGGLVVIHAASVAMKENAWWKATIGGSWVKGQTKWKEGPMDLYFTENQRLDGGHPITKTAANFHLDDEIYYDMDISPDVRVLATSYTPNVPSGRKGPAGGVVTIYDIQPQIWVYERTAEGGAQPYRAFVSIPGHLNSTFDRANYRAILLRGIAWAGKRANIDEFVKPEELSSLTYPEGGPQKPEQTLANLEIHPDFTMKLVAAEPLITKPMCIDWDPSGRLWVAETPEYPNGRRGMRPDYRGKEWKDHGGIDPTPGLQDRPGKDRISILIDTNGDGVMDKKEVFYEGLELVTGFVFYKDGVIVTQAPDILWLRDTDGDGKADKVEKLYTGLGTSDTHAVINNPRWGWDGWIYATHGYSASNKVQNANGELQGAIGSGVVRFLPDGSKIEQYSSKGGNTWGLTVTGDNRVMWTQPTSGQLLMQTVLPEYTLARGKVGNTQSFKVVEPSLKTFPLMTWEEQAYRQIDWVGSFTAAAGCVIYDGGAWPAEYNGDYFTTEPTLNIIHHARLTPEGSSYTFHKLPGREQTEFIRSKDMWWRPIEVRVGPDGAMYVCDFYNQAVIHNDTRGPDHNKVNAAVRPDRDHYFGRIWKIEHKQQTKLTVPDLAKVGTDELLKQLGNSNRAVRMTASRLIVEHGGEAGADVRKNIAFNYGQHFRTDVQKMSADERIAAMWTLHRLDDGADIAGLRGQLSGIQPAELESAMKHSDASTRRNAAAIAELVPYSNIEVPLSRLVSDADAQVRLVALRSLGRYSFSDGTAGVLVAAWPKLDDEFQRSAAVGAASRNPTAVISAALDAAGGTGRAGVPPAAPGILPGTANVEKPSPASADAASLSPLVSAVAQNITAREDAAKLVIAIAGKPGGADPLKRTILDTLAKSVKDAPTMTPELSAAFTKLLASSASGSALPLAAKWDTTGALKPEIARLTKDLILQLKMMGGDENVVTVARTLIGLRDASPEALPAVTRLLGPDVSATPALQKGLITALGETADPAIGKTIAAAFGKLSPDAQAVAFDTLLKRPDWSLAFLDAVASKQVDPALLGPGNAYRLRTHPDKAVATRATEMLEALNPTAKVKDAAIAKLLPDVEKPGDVARGKQLFTATCAICHKFGDLGADIGPALTGMGSHGPSELLTAIVDPNREVDPTYAAWNIETKDGQSFVGIVASENPASVTLKSLAGVQEVKAATIKTRVNTGRSLMPEGFDGLGGEVLRDIVAYMQSEGGGKFRTLDLSRAYTANTGRGLYVSDQNKGDTLVFAKTGPVTVEGVPFNIVAPERAPMNTIVLKGGPERSFSSGLAERVDVPVGGFKANRLHFLGGVAGWGFPFGDKDVVVMRVTAHFADGQRESFNLKNGVEFADYIREVDVPGSKITQGLVKGGHQLRWFTLRLSRAGELERVTLESLNTGVAPTTVAITAELADERSTGVPPVRPAGVSPAAGATAGKMPAGPTAGTAVPQPSAFVPQFTDKVPEPPATATGTRILLVGGGSSHDFAKYYGGSDKATLAAAIKPLWIDYTQNANGTPAILDRVDVLGWSANQPVSSETCAALMKFANSGKGLIPMHPGTWYAWRNFPQWNKEIVGGGTNGHDKLGEFEVTVTDRTHPVTAGLPEKFKITDELYNFIPDPAGTPIQVLATATSPTTGKIFPQIWIVKHPKSKVVCITLGHDARAHDLPEYQTLIKNAFKWAAEK